MSPTALPVVLVAGCALADALRRARWSAPVRSHLAWAAATLAVAVLQRARIPFAGGLELHYQGAAWLALLLGYPRALVSLAAVFTAHAVTHAGIEPAAFARQFLVDAVAPAWAIVVLARAARRWLPANPFVFLIGVAFLGVALVNALQVLAGALLTAPPAAAPWRLWHEFVPAALLLAWGEALVEGMVTSVLVVFARGSVRLFDEALYLRRAAPPGRDR